MAGRRQERLDELVEEGKKKGGQVDAVRVDVTAGADQLKKFVQDVTKAYPQLDTVIFSSGIQRQIDFTDPGKFSLDVFNQEITTNYTSVVTLITYFLPHLLDISSQGRPTFLIPISSFLSVIPIPNVPGYCATKAAIHSLCISLRQQLKGKGVHVLEIIPPLVESELHDYEGTTPQLAKFWMSLDEFTKETLEGLIHGEPEIYPGNKETYDKFEKGKLEVVEQRTAAFARWTAQVASS